MEAPNTDTFWSGDSDEDFCFDAKSDDDFLDCYSVTGGPVFQIGDGHSKTDFDPDALRAKIDTGAFTWSQLNFTYCTKTGTLLLMQIFKSHL